jgi:hypothetical protein
MPGADVAQLVERRLPKPKVAGSRPVVRFGGAQLSLLLNDLLGAFVIALGVATGSPVVAAAVGGVIVFVLAYRLSRQIQ